MSKRALALVLATALAVPAEGLRQVAYRDPVGLLTICYGDTHGVVEGQTATLEECKARLEKGMLVAIEQVERCHPGLPDNVLAAFADAVYNIGPAVACNSTASRYLSEGNHIAACQQLPRWNKACRAGVCVALPGLTKRRIAEMTLCMKGMT